jgi:hypothetical protein
MKKETITNITSEINSLLNNMPDTQEDIISELKNDIICGKYELNPKKIVERILWHGIYFFVCRKVTVHYENTDELIQDTGYKMIFSHPVS